MKTWTYDAPTNKLCVVHSYILWLCVSAHNRGAGMIHCKLLCAGVLCEQIDLRTRPVVSEHLVSSHLL